MIFSARRGSDFHIKFRTKGLSLEAMDALFGVAPTRNDIEQLSHSDSNVMQDDKKSIQSVDLIEKPAIIQNEVVPSKPEAALTSH